MSPQLVCWQLLRTSTDGLLLPHPTPLPRFPALTQVQMQLALMQSFMAGSCGATDGSGTSGRLCGSSNGAWHSSNGAVLAA